MGTYHSIAKYAVVLVAKCGRDERVLWDNVRPTGEAPKSRMWSRECGRERPEPKCCAQALILLCTTLYYQVTREPTPGKHLCFRSLDL
jgi:hypothetical protein